MVLGRFHMLTIHRAYRSIVQDKGELFYAIEHELAGKARDRHLHAYRDLLYRTSSAGDRMLARSERRSARCMQEHADMSATMKQSKADLAATTSASWEPLWKAFRAAQDSGDVDALNNAKGNIRSWHIARKLAVPQYAQ